MRISEIYRPGTFGLSIEIFPPKSTDGDTSLFENLDRLARYQPAFISCTYGAGGSTRNRTVELCTEIQRRYEIAATAHFTCVGSSQEDLREWLTYARQQGVRNIMALRGDPPQGQTEFTEVQGGFRNANQLVALIKSEFPELGIGVAGYPEKHPGAVDLATDLVNLKRKVDAGADAVFTQLFYVNDHFYRFRDACTRLGVHVPLVPGIMPITEFARIKRITAMCKTDFPEDLARRLEDVQDDKQAQLEIGVEFAINQCRELIEQGVPGIHFYALNKSHACEMILDALDHAKTA